MPSTVTYPGLADFKAVDFTFTPGIQPSTCVVTTHPNRAGTLAPQGTLVLNDGSRTLQFPDCRVNSPGITAGNGTTLRVPIQDRRWRWQFGAISGNYNVPQPDDTILREKTPRELATLLLNAMGEVGFDVSRLPNATRPEVLWEFANPARELDALCQELSCIVNLNAADNKVEIWPEGDARAPLPIAKVKSGGDSLALAAKPKTLKVVGDRTIFEGGFGLFPAVGIETDGTIKDIDDLSYTPVDGWGKTSLDFYSIVGTYNDPETGEVRNLRDLAKSCIWRMYAMQLPPVPPLLQGTPLAPQSLDDVEILSHRAVSRVTIFGDKEYLPPEVNGYRYVADISGNIGNQGGKFDIGFTINQDRGIIQFSEPAFRLGNGEYIPIQDGFEPAKLTTGYHAGRDGVFHRYTKDLDIGGELGTRIIEQHELQRRIQINNVDNVADLDPKADAKLAAIQGEYDPQQSSTRTYAGWQYQATDGLVRQVSWNFSPGGGTTTTVSAASVHNPFAKTDKAKRREAKADA